MFKIAICDFNQCDMNVLNSLIKTTAMRHEMMVKIDLYQRGIDLLNDLANGKEIDLLFIEVDMGEEDGKEIVRHFQIMMKIKNIKFIFMSRSANNIMSLFELKPYHFITKPFNELMVEELILEVNNRYATNMSFAHYHMGKTVSRTDNRANMSSPSSPSNPSSPSGMSSMSSMSNMSDGSNMPEVKGMQL